MKDEGCLMYIDIILLSIKKYILYIKNKCEIIFSEYLDIIAYFL